MKNFLLISGLLLLAHPVKASDIWLEHQPGQPWQRANPAHPPLSMQTWLLQNQIDGDWVALLDNQLKQHYCKDELSGLGPQFTRSHFIPRDDQVLLSIAMQRQLNQSNSLQRESWLQLTPAQARSAIPMYLMTDRSAGLVNAVMVPENGAPQTLWQFNFLPSQSAEILAAPLILTSVDLPERRTVLILPAKNALGLQLVDPHSGRVVTLESDSNSEFIHATAMPAVLDTDLNGATDRIYQISETGLLYQINLDPSERSSARLVADLRTGNARFVDGLTATQARWPAADGWQQGDVIVAQALRDEKQQLYVIKISNQQQQPIVYEQLSKRSVANPDPDAEYGWRYELNGLTAAMPSLMAGVLYLPLQDGSTRCGGNASMDRLLALHLYNGNQVYDRTEFQFSEPLSTQLKIIPQQHRFLLKAGEHLVTDEMKGVTVECPDCVATLDASQFPKWQRIASYQVEQGAY